MCVFGFDGAGCVLLLPAANTEQSSWGDLGAGRPFPWWDQLMPPGKCRLKGWGLLPGSVLDTLAIKDAKNPIFPEKKGRVRNKRTGADGVGH